MEVADLFTALAATLETNLSMPFGLGYPSWGRPRTGVSDLPTGAIQLNGLAMTPYNPIGGRRLVRVATWDVWLFAKDEIELVTKLDLLASWLRQSSFDVNDIRVVVSVEVAERHVPDQTIQQEQHGFVLTLKTEW